MRTAIVMICLLLLGGVATAQTRPGSIPGSIPGTGHGTGTGSASQTVPGTAPTAPSRPSSSAPIRATEPQRDPTGAPKNDRRREGQTSGGPAAQPSANGADRPAPRLNFARLVPGCVAPGQTFLLQGQGFDQLDITSAFLLSSSQKLKVRIVGVSAGQIALQLAATADLQSQRYEVILASLKPGSDINTGLSLRPCTDRAGAQSAEILLMGAPAELPAVTAELTARNIPISESYNLQGLEQFLLVITATDVQSFITEFRALFPNVSIDLNANLQAASAPAPRLFANALVKWPAKTACDQVEAKIKLGLLDGTIKTAHPAFKSATIRQSAFIGTVAPDQGHGTAIASLLVGDAPDLGIFGLLPKANLYNAVVLRRGQSGPLARVTAIVRGLNWLASEQVRLVSISLATLSQNRVLERSSRLALGQGMILFAAAGNSGPDAGAAYPAAYPGIFAVTAIDAAKQLYPNANVGDYIAYAAPGVDIWMATPDGGGAYKTGTSFAAPYALAIAALYVARNPNLSGQVLDRILSQTALRLGTEGQDRLYGRGLLQAKC